jgi:hypothetical protein
MKRDRLTKKEPEGGLYLINPGRIVYALAITLTGTVLLSAAYFALNYFVHQQVYSESKPVVMPARPKDNLAAFLASPLDLAAFKKKKGSSNNGAVKKNPYFYKPQKTGFFYQYMLFPSPRQYNEGERFNGFSIVVYKFGKKVGDYSETNETLVGIWCRLKDPDLGAADLVGSPVSKIKERFGEPFAVVGDVLVYQHQGKALSIHAKDAVVDWFKYVRLNREMASPGAVPELLLKPHW